MEAERTPAEFEQISRAMAAERVWAATLAVAPNLQGIYSSKKPGIEPGTAIINLDSKAWAETAVNLGIVITNAYAAKMQELESAAMQQAAQ